MYDKVFFFFNTLLSMGLNTSEVQIYFSLFSSVENGVLSTGSSNIGNSELLP